MQVENVDKVCRILKQRQAETEPSASVTVGYTQKYAIYVHERQAHHKVGQWKFLETAVKRFQKDLAAIIRQAIERKLPLEKALLLAGLRLQREAQKLTPVDTGALKASAFTCLTRDEDIVGVQSFIHSELVRQRKRR